MEEVEPLILRPALAGEQGVSFESLVALMKAVRDHFVVQPAQPVDGRFQREIDLLLAKSLTHDGRAREAYEILEERILVPDLAAEIRSRDELERHLQVLRAQVVAATDRRKYGEARGLIERAGELIEEKLGAFDVEPEKGALLGCDGQLLVLQGRSKEALDHAIFVRQAAHFEAEADLSYAWSWELAARGRAGRPFSPPPPWMEELPSAIEGVCDSPVGWRAFLLWGLAEYFRTQSSAGELLSGLCGLMDEVCDRLMTRKKPATRPEYLAPLILRAHACRLAGDPTTRNEAERRFARAHRWLPIASGDLLSDPLPRAALRTLSAWAHSLGVDGKKIQSELAAASKKADTTLGELGTNAPSDPSLRNIHEYLTRFRVATTVRTPEAFQAVLDMGEY